MVRVSLSILNRRRSKLLYQFDSQQIHESNYFDRAQCFSMRIQFLFNFCQTVKTKRQQCKTERIIVRKKVILCLIR